MWGNKLFFFRFRLRIPLRSPPGWKHSSGSPAQRAGNHNDMRECRPQVATTAILDDCPAVAATETDGGRVSEGECGVGVVSVSPSGATAAIAQVIDETETSFAAVAAYTESTEDTVPASAGDPVGLDGWVRQIPTIDEIMRPAFDYDLMRARLMGCFLMWKHWPIVRKRFLSIQNVDQSPMDAGIADTSGGSGYQSQRGGEGSGEVLYKLFRRDIQ